MADAARPLSGLRVIDLTTTIAGPYCARLLADAGAEVIKVESPEGDLTRSRPPIREGASTSYGGLNAGKRSIVLDLKQEAAVEVVRRLAAGADVLVENYRPGVMQRFGLGAEGLLAANPRLIYCAISGFGQTGPSSQLAAYAPAIHASSGFDLAHLAYQPGRTVPDFCGIYIADVLSGTYAYGAIATALAQRARTGRGQMIDVSMLESMLQLTLGEVQGAQFTLPPPPPRHMFGPVATADGYVLPAIASERTFQNAAKAAGREDWITDPRFEKYPDRRDNWAVLMDEMEAWSRTLPTQAVEAAFAKAGVPCSAYRTVREALADPQLAHRGALAEVRDGGGSFKVMNPPFRMSGGAVQVREFAAGLGEHSGAILAEAGYSESEISALRTSGAVPRAG
jgi:crotonobetainyl-CoA:carnitine CoA-transferase CaiB-like acyl-CoA transferase